MVRVICKILLVLCGCLLIASGIIFASETITWQHIETGGTIDQLRLVLREMDSTLCGRPLTQQSDNQIQSIFLSGDGFIYDKVCTEAAVAMVQSINKIPSVSNALQGRYLSIPASYVELTSRVDFSSFEYTLLVPTQLSTYYTDRFVLEGVTWPGLDFYGTRVSRYKQLFLDAALQPDLMGNVIDPNALANRTGQLLNILELAKIPSDVATEIVHATQWVDDANYVQKILVGSQNLPQGPLHHAFANLRNSTAWLTVFELGYRFTNDGIQQMLLQCLANADAETRLDAMERLLGRQVNLDPAMWEGFLEARSAFATMTETYYSNFAQAAMDGVANDPRFYVSSAALATGIAQTIIPALSGLGWVVGPYFLSAQVYFAVQSQEKSSQLACAAATLQQLLYTDNGIGDLHSQVFESEVTPSEPASDLLHLFNLNYWLGHYFNARMKEVANNWLSSLWYGLLYPNGYEEMVNDLNTREVELSDLYNRTKSPYFLSWYKNPIDAGDDTIEWPWLSDLIDVSQACNYTFWCSNAPITPDLGISTTNFTFVVSYKHPSGKQPASVSCEIDGGDWTQMDYVGGDYTVQVDYSYSRSGLSVGTHRVEFDCEMADCDNMRLGPFPFQVVNPAIGDVNCSVSPVQVELGNCTGGDIILLDESANPIANKYITVTCDPPAQIVYDYGHYTNDNGRFDVTICPYQTGSHSVSFHFDGGSCTTGFDVVNPPACPFSISLRPSILEQTEDVVRLELRAVVKNVPSGTNVDGETLHISIAECDDAVFEETGTQEMDQVIEGGGLIPKPVIAYTGEQCSATICATVKPYSCSACVGMELETKPVDTLQPIVVVPAGGRTSYYGGPLVGWSWNCQYLAAGPGPTIYDTRNWNVVRSLASPRDAFAFSPLNDDYRLFLGAEPSSTPEIEVYDLFSGRLCTNSPDPDVDIIGVTWSSDGDRIFCTDYTTRNRVLEFNSTAPCQFTSHVVPTAGVIYDIDAHSDLVAIAADDQVMIYQTSSWIQLPGSPISVNNPMGVAFSNEGTKLAVTRYDNEPTNLSIIDISNSCALSDSAFLAIGRNYSVDWSPDDSRLAVWGDYIGAILDATTLLPITHLAKSDMFVGDLDWGPNNLIAVAVAGGTRVYAPYDVMSPSLTDISPNPTEIVQNDSIVFSAFLHDDFSIGGAAIAVNFGTEDTLEVDTDWTITYPINMSGDSVHLAIRYWDRSGHESTSEFTYKRFVDHEPPVITNVGHGAVTTLADGSVTSEITARVFDNWSGVADSGVVAIVRDSSGLTWPTYLADDNSDSLYVGIWQGQFGCDEFLEIDISATDEEGNTDTLVSAKTLDVLIPPVCSGIALAPAEKTDTTRVMVTANWEDCSGVSNAGIAYCFQDSANGWQYRNMTINRDPNTIEYLLPRFNTGWVYFYIRITDIYGSASISAIDSFLVRDVSTPGPPQLLLPYNNQFISNSKPTLQWSDAIDRGGSGIDRYTLMLSSDGLFDDTLYVIDVDESEWVVPIDLHFGQYFWKVRAIDSAGNVGNESQVFNFFVDNASPLHPDSLHANESLVGYWTNDPIFTIRYFETDGGFISSALPSEKTTGAAALGDTSGISLAYYKLGSAPTASSDFTGVTPYNPFTLEVNNRNTLYVWLKDGAGNADFRNWASVDLLFDDDPVTGVKAFVAEDTIARGDSFKVTWNSGTDGEGSGTTGVYDIYVKISTGNWRELAVGQHRMEIDTTLDIVSDESSWVFLEVATRDQVGNYDSTGLAEDSILVAMPTGIEDDDSRTLPEKFALSQNFPNPFNPATQISFSLPKSGLVKLEVFNALGQKVETLVDGMLTAGEHTATWDASEMASGVYLYRLQASDFIETKKMILLK